MIIFGFGYDKDGFNKHGFDREGYDRLGFNADGWDRDGFDHEGYDCKGYDRSGYDKDGYNKEGYDKRGYNREGYDENGFDSKGFNKRGFDRAGYDCMGLDAQGYDRDGYNTAGYDRDGFDRDGFDRGGFDAEGYMRSGFDRLGYNREGFNFRGYNKAGFDRDGFDEQGFDSEGFGKDGFDSRGFDRFGYDKDGLDEEGYDRDGFDKCGFNKRGFDKEGFNARGFDADGVHRNGTRYDQDGFNSDGLDEVGLDVDGFDGRGLNPLEIDAKSTPAHNNAEEEASSVVRRAYLMCEDADFSKAHELVEMALNSNPEDGDAYLVALMVEKGVTSEDQLSFVSALDFEDLTESTNYLKAMRFGSQKVKARLAAYAQRNKELTNDWLVLERDELRGRILIMSRFVVSRDRSIHFDREENLRSDNVSSIPGNYITWEDSAVREWMNGAYLDSLPPFIKDRLIESEICTPGTARDWHYYPYSWQVPECTTWDRVFALSVDEVQKYFWSEHSRIARYKDSSTPSLWGLRSPGFYRVSRFPGLGWNSMTDGATVVCNGIFSIGNGVWGSAYGSTAGSYNVDRYADVSDYRPAMWIESGFTPSDASAENWFPGFPISYPEDIRVGATRNISFGGHLWRVLDVEGDAALLITESIVRIASYADKTLGDIYSRPLVNWESSPVRRWLNSTFFDEMDDCDSRQILSKKNVTQDNAFIKNAPAFDDAFLLRHSEHEPQVTVDKVFCLDPFEAAKYFSDDASRVSMRTGDPMAWHLRSYSREIGREIGMRAYAVDERGCVGLNRKTAIADSGVRPAVWIRLP